MTTIRYINKTVVDNNNIMWTLDYDKGDNTVTITSDYAMAGSCAILSHTSLDNGLGQDIPEAVIDSAAYMLGDDVDEDTAHYVAQILDRAFNQ